MNFREDEPSDHASFWERENEPVCVLSEVDRQASAAAQGEL